MRAYEKRSPRGSGGQNAGRTTSTEHSNQQPGRWQEVKNRLVPPRLQRQLPPLKDANDVDLTVKLRCALRSAVNRGDRAMAAHLGDLCATLVLRRAGGV